MSLFSKSTLRIDRDLYEELAAAAAQHGYSSPQEMAGHLLSKALQSLKPLPVDQDESEDRRIAEEQLRGLGYLK